MKVDAEDDFARLLIRATKPFSTKPTPYGIFEHAVR
jgi:hypothetical protein